MDYCPHCMKPAGGKAVCPHCGKPTSYTAGAGRLPVGTVLPVNGGWHNYLLGAVLGQGGFGITYIASLKETGQRVAIKEYLPSHCAMRNGASVVAIPGKEASYEKGLKGFIREAQLLAGLRPLSSVVKAMDFFQYNGTAYLAMEYLDGISLSSKVREEGKISPEELMPRLQQLLQDMDVMHKCLDGKNGIIHRDVAPDNIMWMPDGTLKLMDFGCARSTESAELTVQLKPRFAPVEQYTKRNQGPWTDVYGIAATIYYCLTGIAPADAIARLDDPGVLVPPRELGINLTVQQERSLMWGLEVQPTDRPESMAVFASQLYAGYVSPVTEPQQPAETAELVQPAKELLVDKAIKLTEKAKALWEENKDDRRLWWILGGAAALIALLLLL